MANKLRELLLDIIKHTASTGIVEAVKVTTDETDGNLSTRIESMDADKTVIIKGTLHEAEPKFVGSVGMTKLSILKGFAELANHRTDAAVVDIRSRERGGQMVSEEIVFVDENGTTSKFRLMGGDVLPNARFLGAKWNVEFTPSKSAVAEFSQKASILSSLESFFWVSLVDGVLRFNVGEDGATHATSCIMDTVDGKLSPNITLSWPSQLVLNILKLDTNNTSLFKISEDGAAMIEIKSDFATWQYILPARMKR